jgi:hypothetical protein
MSEPLRCEGWRRHGGAFTFGPVTWKQCTETPTVWLKVKQTGKTQRMPACPTCWQESIDNEIEILEAVPITESK